MLPAHQSPRKRAARSPFRTPLWDAQHPEFCRIDATLPPDHHARWLAAVVSRLDLQTFRLSYAGYGSPAYPVELLLAFVLFLYSKGCLSPAAWARQARYDDQAKWLLRGLQPSRSRLYAFRDRVEPFLDGWHQQLIRWAIAEGITTATRGSLDGSFVAALASRHQLMSARRIDRRLWLLRLLVWLDGQPSPDDLASRVANLPETVLCGVLLGLGLLGAGLVVSALFDTLLGWLAVLELLSPHESTLEPVRVPAWVPATPAGRQRVLRRYEDAQRRLTARLEPYQHKKKLSQKDQQAVKRMKVSLTDPEAALGWDKAGTYRPLYNVLLVQATDAPLTLAWDVLPRNNDDGLLQPMMEKTQEQLGRAVPEVLVDGAFVSVADVVWCEQEGIVVYAPLAKTEAAKEEVVQAEQGKATSQPPASQDVAAKQEKFPKPAFRYDRVARVYYCPEGQRLEEAYRTTEQRQGGRVALPVIVHRAAGQDCRACPQQQQCTSNPKKGRVVKRYEGEEALERLRERMATPAAQAVYKERCRSVELGYADIKEHRGLRVFRCFGRKRARAQAGLVILASNGLKIRAALQRRQNAKPPPSVPEKQPA